MSVTPIPFAWTPPRAPAPCLAEVLQAASGSPEAACERELLRQAVGGVEKAQAWLVQRVVGPVRAVARTLLRNRDDADDAAQKALLEILMSVRTYRGEGSIEAWARRITVRTALRHASAERRQPTTAAIGLPGADSLAAQRDSTAADGLPRPVQEYLAELPEAQRDALVLHHALGYTVPEIAELTDVGLETVRGRLRLGTATLRKRVRQEVLLGANTRRDAP